MFAKKINCGLNICMVIKRIFLNDLLNTHQPEHFYCLPIFSRFMRTNFSNFAHDLRKLIGSNVKLFTGRLKNTLFIAKGLVEIFCALSLH